MRANESRFAFFERSATRVGCQVRLLLNDWVQRYPRAHRSELIANLQSGEDDHFESAFWELYLHEAYRRSGYELEVHPDIPGTTTHPDFRVAGASGHFYLEAVRLGTAPAKRGEERRLQDLQTQVDKAGSARFMVILTVHTIGPKPASGKVLRGELQRWLQTLDTFDPAEVGSGVHPATGLYFLPSHEFSRDGWKLEFHALPRHSPITRHRPLVTMHRRSQPQIIRNIAMLSGVLDGKANKYGSLDAPLVIAVLCNTWSPTQDHQIQEALYGYTALPPGLSAQHPEGLYSEGHWLTKSGWRRNHAPQVITAVDLHPWWVASRRPQLWSTREPGAAHPAQPSWLSEVDASTVDPVIEPGISPAEHFDLPPDWASAPPDFDDS